MSRTQERTNTDIEVNVVNFEAIQDELSNDDEFMEQIREQDNSDHEIIGVSITSSEHGWVNAKDEDGIYVLDNEAIVYEEPISEDNTFILEIRPRYAKNDDGSRPMSMVAVGTIKLDDDDIRDLEVQRTENIKEFVRSFGSRIEANYEQCVKLLDGNVEV
jgi:hypothetical protein